MSFLRKEIRLIETDDSIVVFHGRKVFGYYIGTLESYSRNGRRLLKPTDFEGHYSSIQNYLGEAVKHK